MKIYLKIKIKSLAAEATMIHREERRHNPGHRARVRARRLLDGKTKLPDHELVNMDARRSRAARILKQKPNMDAFWGLRHHRQYDVRGECRSAHVAYGFLNGLPYKRIEPNTKTDPNWSRVEDLIKKYGDGDIRVRLQRFAEWKEAAQS